MRRVLESRVGVAWSTVAIVIVVDVAVDIAVAQSGSRTCTRTVVKVWLLVMAQVIGFKGPCIVFFVVVLLFDLFDLFSAGSLFGSLQRDGGESGGAKRKKIQGGKNGGKEIKTIKKKYVWWTNATISDSCQQSNHGREGSITDELMNGQWSIVNDER